MKKTELKQDRFAPWDSEVFRVKMVDNHDGTFSLTCNGKDTGIKSQKPDFESMYQKWNKRERKRFDQEAKFG